MAALVSEKNLQREMRDVLCFGRFGQICRRESVLVGGYVDASALNILSKRKKGIAVGIMALPSARLTTSDVREFESQHGSLSIARTADFRDKFFVIGGVICRIGASRKDANNKTFAIVLVDDENGQNLLGRIDNLFERR